MAFGILGVLREMFINTILSFSGFDLCHLDSKTRFDRRASGAADENVHGVMFCSAFNSWNATVLR